MKTRSEILQTIQKHHNEYTHKRWKKYLKLKRTNCLWMKSFKPIQPVIKTKKLTFWEKIKNYIKRIYDKI